jgi:SpoIID/LytB domain protein
MFEMFNPLFSIPITMLALTPTLPTQIHVKIFPHLSNFEPMGRDEDPTQITLKSSGACKVYSGQETSAASTGTLKFTLPSLNTTISIKSLVSPLWYECDSPITVIRRGAKQNYSYSGSLYVHPVKTGPEVIEVGSVNDYLKGVVPSEMYAAWPAEALKAQAVAARTYAIFHIILNAGAQPYDVDDTVMFQAYTGNGGHQASTDAAVDATGSTIMVYQDKIIQAYFSADAGGYTEQANAVWNVVAPYCVSKPEIYPDAPIDPAAWGPWNVSLALDDFNQKLVAQNLITDSNPVTDLRVNPQDKDLSGRAKTVTLDLTDGTSQALDANVFRRTLGLKSNLFDTWLDGDQIAVQGRGFGHGVGMGQYGARVLAQVGGWDVDRILHFYYDGIQLCDSSNASGAMTCR